MEYKIKDINWAFCKDVGYVPFFIEEDKEEKNFAKIKFVVQDVAVYFNTKETNGFRSAIQSLYRVDKIYLSEEHSKLNCLCEKNNKFCFIYMIGDGLGYWCDWGKQKSKLEKMFEISTISKEKLIKITEKVNKTYRVEEKTN